MSEHDRQSALRRPGRPRDPEVDAMIIQATQHALAEEGYARMSVDAIALAAKVTKPTIYRRWPTKADLATAAVAALQTQSPPRPNADFREEMLGQLRHFREGLARPLGMAMIGTLLTEETHIPELMKLFRERIVSTRRGWLRTALLSGIARGELRPDLDVDAMLTMLLGSYYAYYLEHGEFTAGWDERILDAIWPSMSTAAPRQPG